MVDCRLLIESSKNDPAKSAMLPSPGPVPYRAPRRPVPWPGALPESPISPCPPESHPARCGSVCANWYRPPAVRRTATGAPVARPPKYTGNCCRSLPSTSYRASPLFPKSTFPKSTMNNAQACYGLSGEIEPSTVVCCRLQLEAAVAMIPRNGTAKPLPGCTLRRKKGIKNTLHPVSNICQATTIRQGHCNLLLVRQRPAPAGQALGAHNRLQAFDGLPQVIVDQNIVVFVVILNLTAGRDQTALDNLFFVFASVAQAPFQRLAVRRQNKNTDSLSEPVFDLLRALHVNIEQNVSSLSFCLAQHIPASSVVVAEYFGVLQKFIRVNHALELVARHEKVLLAIFLASPRQASGVGDGEVEVRNQLQQLGNQRGLARARRSGNDVNQRLVGSGHSRRGDSRFCIHSRFCTCSRDFSISAFMANPASVILSASPARPDVFESSVLASRFISCRRKSSFLPTSPPSSSNPRKCCTCVSSRTISS